MEEIKKNFIQNVLNQIEQLVLIVRDNLRVNINLDHNALANMLNNELVKLESYFKDKYQNETKNLGEGIKFKDEFLIVNKCPKCDGKWKFYDGILGYESYKCEKCNFDIGDIKVVVGEVKNNIS